MASDLPVAPKGPRRPRAEREVDVTSKLARACRALGPHVVVFRHSEMVEAGIPDLSLTLYGRTLWVEVKLVTPRSPSIFSRGPQRINLERLECNGLALYAVFDSDTHIVWLVRPHDITQWILHWAHDTRECARKIPALDGRFAYDKVAVALSNYAEYALS